jgi:predicted house-cleaning noncanonical NTP pyrophosphatase (MazG superfamily)
VSVKKYQFNKLIRSKLPERMGLEGVNIVGRHLNDEEFKQELKNKLLEEAIEVKDADSRDNLLKELADIMEVIESIISVHNITKEEVEKERIIKREVNGYFLPVNFVDYIEVPLTNKKVIEYLETKNRPYKFKE